MVHHEMKSSAECMLRTPVTSVKYGSCFLIAYITVVADCSRLSPCSQYIGVEYIDNKIYISVACEL